MVVSNFSDQVPPNFSESVRPRSTSLLRMQVSKTNSFRSHFQLFQPLFGGYVWINLREHFPNLLYDTTGAVHVVEMLRIIVTSSEIIFGLCEFLPVKPTKNQRLSQMGISRGFDLSGARLVTGKQPVPRCPAWRNLTGLGAVGRTVVAV